MRQDLAAVLARPIAHRGLHERARGIVENSLSAAEAAIAEQFGIECDIWLSRDGEAVVFHDETLDRLTSATGRVDLRSARELNVLTLNGSRDTIPTLSRFLAHLDGRTPLVIEIKSRFDGDMRLASRAVTVIADYRGPVVLKSFDPVILAHCRALGAPCPLGLVGPGASETRDAAPYDFLSWKVAALPALMPSALDLPLMSWTVRSREEHDAAARYRAQIVFEQYRPTEDLRRHASDLRRPSHLQ